MLPIAEPTTLRQRLSDGVELVATLWRPVGDDSYPVLLMRQPYGRTIASTVVYAHPAWYAAHGYLVVIQDVRGTGDSGGSFDVFANEAADGAEAVEWAASLPGSTGVVGMYGFSYQGITQWLALSQAPPSLKAVIPSMAAWTLRDDWAYENGAFHLALTMGWTLQLGAIQARRHNDAERYAKLGAGMAAPPHDGPIPVRPEQMAQWGAAKPHFDWIDHPDDDSYWQARAPSHHFAGKEKTAIPALHIGGWYDYMLTGTTASFRYFDAADHELLIGPWSHIPWSSRVGSIEFGPEAASPVDTASIAFFDKHLKGRDSGASRVRLFDMGTRSWWQGDSEPAAVPTAFFLTTKGNASGRADEGALERQPGGVGIDRFVHDPWHPVPSAGGHVSPLQGPHDRASIDGRNDVATYTSAVLAEPLRIAGDVTLELYVESGAVDFDVNAVLSWVEPDGRVLNLVEAHTRIGGSKALPLRLPMRTTLMTVPTGSRIRLSVAAAAFPAYPVNPGTGTDPTQATGVESLPISISIRSGADFPSALILPIAS